MSRESSVTEDALTLVTAFVEGRIAAGDFEQRLYNDPAIEGLLADDPRLPENNYVGRSVHLYLLELDYGDPGDVLNAQGALAEWLVRHEVPHVPSTTSQDLYNVIRSAQPNWLDADARYIQERFLSRAGERSGPELRDWLRAELLEAFRYVHKPPEWIQSPEWPIGRDGPLVFLGQVEVEKYFHDVASAYVFHDPKTGDCTTVLQVA